MASSFWSIASQQAKISGIFLTKLTKLYCVLHVTASYLGFPGYCYGPSMNPTLHPSGNVVLVERISVQFEKVGRGDIVFICSPEDPTMSMTKRVIGVDGDHITFVMDPGKNDKSQTITVPKGHVWVQGDDPHKSRDSRYFGSVPYSLIEGRVFWRVWPFQDFGPLGPDPTVRCNGKCHSKVASE